MKRQAPQSRYSQDALKLFGMLVKTNRINQVMTVSELAERVGVSRGLIQRLERGEPGTAIGVAFEAAAVVGVQLFDAPSATLASHVGTLAHTLTLMPKTVRPKDVKVDDDF